MTREQAIVLVREYDDFEPSGLRRWLDYVGMDQTEFYAIAVSSRDPPVWAKNEYGAWIKDNTGATTEHAYRALFSGRQLRRPRVFHESA